MIEKVIGSKFRWLRRAADMLSMSLGEDVKDNKGDVGPEFAFHIETQWRFIKNDSILLASRDIYIPYNEEIERFTEEWDYDEVGRPDEESSIFDVLSKDFEKHFEDAVVSSCVVTPIGDLKITFSNGIHFETFTPSMRKDYFWQLIWYKRDMEPEHFIMFE